MLNALRVPEGPECTRGPRLCDGGLRTRRIGAATLGITRSEFSIIRVAPPPSGKQWLNNLLSFAKVTESRSLRKRRAHEVYRDNNTGLSARHWRSQNTALAAVCVPVTGH